jgi:hypothetical protein
MPSLLVGKIPLSRPRYRWVGNIKMNPAEIRLVGVDWVGLAEDRYKWRAFVYAGVKLHVQ